MTLARPLCAVLLAAALGSVATLPVSPSSEARREQEVKDALVESLEKDMVRAAVAGALARAVRNEQRLEDDILRAAVATLSADRGNPAKQAADVKLLQDLVRRDKRQVDLLAGALAGGGGGQAQAQAGSDSSSILNLLPSILGASSGSGSGGGLGSKAGLFNKKFIPAPTQKPIPGTYDDLIGKGIGGWDPVTVVSNNLGGALQTKFSVFSSLVSLLSNLFTSKAGGAGGGATATASLTVGGA